MAEPIRVLHVCHYLHRGGIETWLEGIFRHASHSNFQHNLLLHDEQPTPFDDLVTIQNGQIYRIPRPTKTWNYGQRIRRLLKREGPFQIVHSHFEPVGLCLRYAQQARVPIRVAHSHVAKIELTRYGRLIGSVARPVARWLLDQYATIGLACSREAASAVFGTHWQIDSRWRLLYYGIDMEPFSQPSCRMTIRQQFQVSQDVPLVINVGRLVPQKNQTHLLKTVAELRRLLPSVRCLVVGEGELRHALERECADLQLSDTVIFAGARSDIPSLLTAADVFLLPSSFEGLPLAVLEAQAAGLPCVLADVVSPETDAIPDLITRIPLRDSHTHWAERIFQVYSTPSPLTKSESLRLMRKSHFNITESVRQLETIYTSSLRGSRAFP